MIIGTIRKKRFRSITYNELRNRIRTTIRDRIRTAIQITIRTTRRTTTVSAAPPEKYIFREYIFIEVKVLP